MSHDSETDDSFSRRKARHGSGRNPAWGQLTLAYLRDLPQQLDAMVRALEEEDYDAIRDHAHRMKGTSGTYRLGSIAEHLGRLERLALSRDGKQVAALIDAIGVLVEAEIKAMDSPATGFGGEQVGEDR
jgi:HPt (histidine-containing phosphotransfer) domain-containing protein